MDNSAGTLSLFYATARTGRICVASDPDTDCFRAGLIRAKQVFKWFLRQEFIARAGTPVSIPPRIEEGLQSWYAKTSDEETQLRATALEVHAMTAEELAAYADKPFPKNHIPPM